MKTITYLALTLALMLCSATWSSTQAQMLALDVAIDTNQMRIAAAAAQEIHVEVYAPSGEMVFDSGAVTNQVVEWKMQNALGERVADGVYLVTIQLKTATGQVRKRIEQVEVGQKRRPGTQQSPNALEATITGTGTTGKIAKFTNTTVIGNSVMTESGGKIGIGTTTPSAFFHVKEAGSDTAVAGVSTGSGIGVNGSSSSGDGVKGQSTSADGVYGTSGAVDAAGVHGVATASGGRAVVGQANAGSSAIGVYGESKNGYGVQGSSTNNYGVFGVGGKYGVFGSSPEGNGVRGVSVSGHGVLGTSSSFAGVRGETSGGSGVAGVTGVSNGTDGKGVMGEADNGSGAIGVFGSTDSGTGVFGKALNGGFGVHGFGRTGTGVFGESNSTTGDGVEGDGFFGVDGVSGSITGAGVFGFNTNGGLAGRFDGDVDVRDTLTKGGGSFKIDHPLDPANKYLYHSFVESPDMMNIYNGNVTLDQYGEAVVTMPRWFNALNKEFRYQLTAIGAPGPNLYISEEMKGNRFQIAGGTPGMKVSWQVTGIRRDAWAEAHRIPVEQDKPEKERGYYLHPELFHQPEEKDVTWALHPELMKRIKERRGAQQQQQ